MNKKNIVLIGFMGTGKTYIGKYISERQNMNFYDTDSIIEKGYKCKISYIFERYGEKYFRSLENKVVKEISELENVVISTGGGIVLNNNNIEILKKKGIIFLLDGSINTILKNLYNRTQNRPLLKGIDWKKKTKELYLLRKELYYKSADFIININNKNREDIAKEIINIFNSQR